MEIIGLLVLKQVSLLLETQANVLFHVHECCSQHGKRYCNSLNGDGNGTIWAGRKQINVAMFHFN
jgi:hypothetical protein